jgi:hypothetical protein
MISDLEIVNGFNADDRLLRPRQAAEMLGLPVQTLARWRHLSYQGKPAPELPFRKLGRAIRYVLADLKKFGKK